MIGAARMAMAGISNQQSFAYGELLAYNPANHTGQFALPGHPDPITGDPTLTGFIQIGAPHVGENGSGAQFPPKIGAQAVIMFLDAAQQYPTFSQWYFNDTDQPPFPDGDTMGWKDPSGASMTTTKDGATPGDGAGAARVAGNKYTSTTTAGGHGHTMDDIAKKVQQFTSGGHGHTMDDIAKKVQQFTSGGLLTVHNDITQEIAHVSPHVNLGDIGENMIPSNAALNQSHLTTFENNQFVKRLDDLTKFATAMVAAGVPNAGAVLAELATLVHIPIPDGSPITNIK